MKRLPTRNSHTCFGCSPINASGLRMVFDTDDKSLFSTLVVPAHLCGWKDMVHGGVISTILDEIMGWSVIYLLQSLALTKSIAVEFLKPVFVGKEVKAEGRVVEVVNGREAVMEGFLYDHGRKLCAKARGVFVILKPERAVKLGMTDEAFLRDIARVFEV